MTIRGSGLCTLLLLLTGTAQAEEAGDLLSRHLEARGGRARIAAVDTLRATGTMYRFGLEYDLEWIYKAPGQGRIRYWGENEHIQGVPGAFEVRSVFDGSSAILAVVPRGEPAHAGRLFPWFEVALRAAADVRGPLLDAKAGEHAWRLEGREELEDGPAWRLRLDRAGGGRELWWLSTETLDLVQRRFFLEHWGEEMWATVSYADFAEIEGLRVAKTQLIDSASATFEWSFEQIEVDVSIRDDTFELDLPDSRP